MSLKREEDEPYPTLPHPIHLPAAFLWNVGSQTGILAAWTCFLLNGVGAAFLWQPYCQGFKTR